jgi:predicted RNA-binding Zn ribbon-like protein
MVSSLPRYQRRVDGVVLPVDVGGDPALDFCNTLAGWNSDTRREYLVSYDHLVVWAREASLIDGVAATRLRGNGARDPKTAERVLERAVTLRRALYAACTDSDAAAAWDDVAEVARTAAGAAWLDRDAPPRHRWQIVETAGLELPLLQLGRAAGEFLATTDLSSVRSCPGKDCGWLFLDPRGRRRWCTMAVCGNRAKARRHAARARGG